MLLGQLNNKMLYKVLHAGMKGASIAKKKKQQQKTTKNHNSGLLGIWEIKCTKYLFRYTHTFLYISNYFQIL